MLGYRRRTFNGKVILSAVEKSILFLFVLIISCNSENAPDCFQSAGDLVRVEVDLPDFSTITVFEKLNLVLRQGDEQRVEIESGEFLVNEISAEVENGRLVVRNDNGCSFFRDFDISTIYVTSPNISEIRSSTGLLISSDGVLSYPSLTLLTESFIDSETETTDGSFDLSLDVEQLSIVVNGIAFFQLNGVTENFNVTIAAGDSRIEAEDLTAQNVSLDHRGTNDIFINPQQSLSGVIRGTGDVISFNRPTTIDVEEIFNGRLIFRE
ncbi:head GIN domain-containing protein [Flagellimonas meridianipacifica]|uniref:Putative autotransporter adhesin-like protein n=1 Tax=Flagellimonas meridianipacifica TaxID=1080225 RepID=A0A2T0MJR7_9FLAO|nr:head GIN domain-containing protein [Allomuricauda pacifica]PRX57838.1 putative autotransporter adhesin-like protein [Allomuricauda pacifica]